MLPLPGMVADFSRVNLTAVWPKGLRFSPVTLFSSSRAQRGSLYRPKGGLDERNSRNLWKCKVFSFHWIIKAIGIFCVCKKKKKQKQKQNKYTHSVWIFLCPGKNHHTIKLKLKRHLKMIVCKSKKLHQKPQRHCVCRNNKKKKKKNKKNTHSWKLFEWTKL